MAASKGAIRMRMSSDRTMSLPRLISPFTPMKGDSQTATTGMPPTWSMRPWIRSVTKMSGTK